MHCCFFLGCCPHARAARLVSTLRMPTHRHHGACGDLAVPVAPLPRQLRYARASAGAAALGGPHYPRQLYGGLAASTDDVCTFALSDDDEYC